MPATEANERGYRDLQVWQKSVALTAVMYDLVDERPETEQWVWELQLKRAAIGISGNIAEGYGTGTWANFRRHVRLAYASGSELESHLLSMGHEGVCVGDTLAECREQMDEVLRLCSGFEDYLTRKLEETSDVRTSVPVTSSSPAPDITQHPVRLPPYSLPE